MCEIIKKQKINKMVLIRQIVLKVLKKLTHLLVSLFLVVKLVNDKVIILFI